MRIALKQLKAEDYATPCGSIRKDTAADSKTSISLKDSTLGH